jgi:tetratricopeptide (TPR) repeat protein
MLNIRLVILLTVFAFIVACSPSAKTSQSDKPASSSGKNRDKLTEEQLINLRFLYVNAVKEKNLGNLDKAIELFAQCIRIDGSNHAAMYELAQIYLEQKKINDAVFFARSAYQLDSKNVWYRLFLAELYMNVRKTSEGESLYEGLFKEYPRNVEYAFKYASALLFNGKLQEAIKVYDKVEQEIGVTSELIIEKERLWLRLGKIDKAALEVEKLIAKNPLDLKSYSLLVELYQVNDMPEKALETIERMQKVNPNSPYVYLALAEYYRSTNQKQKSFDQLRLAFGSNELEHDIKIKIISSYLPLVQGNPEMIDQGLQLAEILAKTHSTDAISLAIHGDFLTIADKFEEARSRYLESLAIDQNSFSVWRALLICQSELGDFDGMKKSSGEALELFPSQSILYLFRGIALSFKKEHEEAVKVLLAGSKLVVDNELELKDFYIRLADNYHTLNQHTESDTYFDKALKIDPRDPLVLNNYAYYLSLRKTRLEKAEQMSKLSNEIRPNEPSYLDTYGWILYVMGDYKGAKEWLQRALDNGGSGNGTILEHMGDTLYQLGEKAKAVEYWKNAKAAGETSDLINKKIADQKLYE